jgi:hypothetical protein
MEDKTREEKKRRERKVGEKEEKGKSKVEQDRKI